VKALTLRSLWARRRRAIGAGIAVVIGVAFLASTMVLGDAMTKGIEALFVEGYEATDVQVRSAHQIDSEDVQSNPIDAALVDQLGALPEVASAAPEVEGTAQITSSDDEPIGGNGPPTIGTNWVDTDRNPYVIVDGRPPEGANEVVIDSGAADTGDLAVGDTTIIRVPEPVEAEIVGIAELESGSELGGVTFTWFDTATAQDYLIGSDDLVTAVDLQAADGVSDEALRAAVIDVVPQGIEALTNAELSAEAMEQMEADFLGFFKTFLLVFAVIALLVACFSINNTFAILVAQRTRESALLRAIGASRRQVLVSVAVEALVIGFIAAAIGLGVGLGLATGLNALMTAAGVGIPSAGMAMSTSVVVTGMVVGVVMTLIAATMPAVRASRVLPIAALRDVAIDRSGASRWRAALGLIVTAGGVATLILATETDEPMTMAALGSLGAFVGFVLLGPVAARAAAGVIGAPVAALRGVTGKLARRNAIRNPKRTSGTASALMVGTAVVALFASLGSSIKESFDDLLAQSFGGDLVVRPEGFSGALLPVELASDVEALPEVEVTAPVRDHPVTIDDEGTWLVASDLDAMLQVADIGDITGDMSNMGRGDLAVSEAWSSDHGAPIGATVDVEYADGATDQLTVVATYTEANLFGDVLVDTSVIDPHSARVSDFIVMIGLADGVALEDGRAAIESVTSDYGDPLIETSDEYLEAQGAQLDQMLGLVYGLLGVAVVIALIGIANTLSLSLYERTRELGLLRAVGQSRRSLRSTVRWESVIVAIFGTLGGVGLGTLLCWGLVRAISVSEGFGTFAPSYMSLAVILGVSVIAGVLAAARPARRAAKLDVLAAIASE
jgi:putative ABC transport system permease protein